MATPGIEKLVVELNRRPQPREFAKADAEKLARYYGFEEPAKGSGSHKLWTRGPHAIQITTHTRKLGAKETQKLRDTINAVRAELGE